MYVCVCVCARACACTQIHQLPFATRYINICNILTYVCVIGGVCPFPLWLLMPTLAGRSFYSYSIIRKLRLSRIRKHAYSQELTSYKEEEFDEFSCTMTGSVNIEGLKSDITMNALLCLKWITNKNLLYSTEITAECSVEVWTGRRLGESRCLYLYGWVPSLSAWNYHNIDNCLYANIK